MNAQYFIDHLQLEPHPEGGFYKETYRSSGVIQKEALLPSFDGNRHYATAIYFLLQKGDFSAFHRIKSDECWHFYDGGRLNIHVIDKNGNYSCERLGKQLDEGETFQFVVPAGCWFASEPAQETAFALVGCTVAPGFDFADFEMGKNEELIRNYPQHKGLLQRLCRL
ncbi:MAG: cupin domain-containing protein [Chitinophagaceae bacterium]|nr:MAG: cupin domain-containing protein [Chitinophagaceae bacterium]